MALPGTYTYHCIPPWAFESDAHAKAAAQYINNSGLNPYTWYNPYDYSEYANYEYNPWVYSGIGCGWMCDSYGNPLPYWYDDWYPYVDRQYQTKMNPGLWGKYWMDQENMQKEGFLYPIREHVRRTRADNLAKGWRSQDLTRAGTVKDDVLRGGRDYDYDDGYDDGYADAYDGYYEDVYEDMRGGWHGVWYDGWTGF